MVLTKIDMVSQAELEIILWQIRQINPRSGAFSGGRSGGLWNRPFWPGGCWIGLRAAALGRGHLRHTMLAAGLLHCVGEQRVGSAFQQGVVGKINFEEAEVCSL